MNNSKILVLVTCILIALSSCSKTSLWKEDKKLPTPEVNGPVILCDKREYTTMRGAQINSAGKIKDYNNFEVRVVYTYNEYGLVLERNETDNRWDQQKYDKYEYDFDVPDSTICYRSSEYVYHYTENADVAKGSEKKVYNSLGLITSSYRQYKDLVTVENRNYDKDGQEIKVTNVSYDASGVWENKYEEIREGNTKTFFYLTNDNGNVRKERKNVKKYDNNDNIIEETEWEYDNGSELKRYNDNYTYNKKNNVVEHKHHTINNGKIQLSSKILYKYEGDEETLTQEKWYELSESGNLYLRFQRNYRMGKRFTSESRYDEYGYCTESIESEYLYNADDKLLSSKQSDGSEQRKEYDEYGNLTLEYYKSASGNISLTVYRYEYADGTVFDPCKSFPEFFLKGNNHNETVERASEYQNNSGYYPDYSNQFDNNSANEELYEESEPKYQICRVCNGSGNCRQCGGAGQINAWRSIIGGGVEEYMKQCPSCRTGTCTACNGEGKIYY